MFRFSCVQPIAESWFLIWFQSLSSSDHIYTDFESDLGRAGFIQQVCPVFCCGLTTLLFLSSVSLLHFVVAAFVEFNALLSYQIHTYIYVHVLLCSCFIPWQSYSFQDIFWLTRLCFEITLYQLMGRMRTLEWQNEPNSFFASLKALLHRLRSNLSINNYTRIHKHEGMHKYMCTNDCELLSLI